MWLIIISLCVLLTTVCISHAEDNMKDIYLYTLLLPAHSDNISITSDKFTISTEYYQIIKLGNRMKLSLENINASIKLIQVMGCRTNKEDGYTLLDEESCNANQLWRRMNMQYNNGARTPLEQPLGYPYTTLVNISSTCTGTVIDYNYVLTTAQCVYFNSYRYPKLYINDKLIPFEKIYLPPEWFTKSVLSEKFRYNYALIKLKKNHFTYTPIHLNMPTSNTLECHSSITLAGYSRKTNMNNITLYKSHCYSSHETENTIWMECENSAHDSGNALFGFYTNNQGRTRNVVRGILIGNYGKYYLPNKLGSMNYNLGLRINYELYLRLCTWMNQLDKCRERYTQLFPLPPLTYLNWN